MGKKLAPQSSNSRVRGGLFKWAGVVLDRLYSQYDARIIVPVHDAIVFEAPLEKMQEVAELTSSKLCDLVREQLPQLRPRAEINIGDPTCWNKGGDAGEFDRWITDLGGEEEVTLAG